MNKLYRNPYAWLSLMMFVGLSLLFFSNYPILATILYGSIIAYVVITRLRSSRHLHKHGYRVVGDGRDSFYYEELVAGQIRRLSIDGELMAKGPRHVYFPNQDTWRAKMPDWAKDRREDILDRIREQLGTEHVKYIVY